MGTEACCSHSRRRCAASIHSGCYATPNLIRAMVRLADWFAERSRQGNAHAGGRRLAAQHRIATARSFISITAANATQQAGAVPIQYLPPYTSAFESPAIAHCSVLAPLSWLHHSAWAAS